MKLSSAYLGHHGLVAGLYDDLGIGEIIDKTLPKQGQHKLPHSVLVKAMIINALGFNERRLYMFPDFFENLDTGLLLGVGVVPEDINDDVLGRTLDRIYDGDPTELFLKIVLEVMEKVPFGTQLLHADTTSVSVHGDYEHIDGSRAIEITYGHTKDNRPDLKQFVMSMITNQHGIPLFVQTYSGNKSDKKSIIESIQRMRKGICIPDAYVIADSAIYTEENIRALSPDAQWITHVPATIGEANQLLTAEISLEPSCNDPRYSFYETTSDYGGIPQKWIVVHSRDMQTRKELTYERNLEKLDRKTQKSLKKLKAIEFACEPDARQAAEQWISANQGYIFQDFSISTSSRKANSKRGRPKINENLKTVYTIVTKVARNEERIRADREKLGRFVLATNDRSLEPECILDFYKQQIHVERMFRFLKDRSFRISEVYLKKPERIEALSMVMVLTLMVYSILEWQIRKRMKEQEIFILNQVKKPTQKPSLKWIFTKFAGVTVVSADIDGMKHRQISHINESVEKIVGILGPTCQKYYT
jgi:transposase